MISEQRYSDEKLVSLLAEDNEAAFGLLYDRYWKKMLVKAYTQLNSQSDAEEVVQDAFTNLWRRRHRLILKFSFHTYIAAVVRYEVMAKIAGKRIGSDIRIDDVAKDLVIDNATQEWLDFEDLRARIELAVKALPEKCQIVFRLSRESGLTEKQIAERLGISPKTVEAHITKALKSLRTTLNQMILSLF